MRTFIDEAGEQDIGIHNHYHIQHEVKFRNP